MLEGGEERVQLRQRRLRPVQHLRYPPLLRRRRQRDFKFRQKVFGNTALTGAASHSAFASKTNVAETQEMKRVTSVQFGRTRTNDMELGRTES